MANEMRDRLVELLKQISFDFCEECVACSEDGYKVLPMLEEFFADHLIENGVIIASCKVGDVVYQTDGVRIYELEILDTSLYKGIPYYETDGIDFDERAVGESIFLTKDQAEQKLKEMRGE